jgi:hypothetical protein
MTSVVGRKLFTVVALLARVLDYCGNFDRRRAVGSGAGFFPSLVSVRLEWTNVLLCRRTKIDSRNTNNLLNNVKYKKVFCLES